MPISSSLRKAVLATGTAALALALVAGAGVASASAAGDIVKLKLLANDAGFYAGTTHQFTVIGYDADGNTVDETANATLTSDAPGDVVHPFNVNAGLTLTLDPHDTSTHILKASLSSFPTAIKGSIALPVVPGTAVGINVVPSTKSVSLHKTISFVTQSVDQYGNSRGNATATYKSSSSHDVVHGSSITFGSYGTRTITVKSQSYTDTATISVLRTFHPKTKFTGTFAVGHTVTSSFTGLPSGVKAVRAWTRDGVAIASATGKSYKIVKADKGHTIKLSYTLSKSGYFTVSKVTTGHKIA
jgi:hypothetical protein